MKSFFDIESFLIKPENEFWEKTEFFIVWIILNFFSSKSRRL